LAEVWNFDGQFDLHYFEDQGTGRKQGEITMEKVSGNRTYMVAAGGVLAAVGAYLSGDMEMGTMINIVITSLLAVFLRKGVKKAEEAAE